MDLLTAILLVLIAIAILFEVARRLGVPYPTLFVIGGLGLGFVPGMPRIELEPDLVLLVFLPPLLFTAAVDTPIRELRNNLAPLLRLSFGLVVVTMTAVAVVAHQLIPDLGWAGAFALGAIVGPTDALAATTVFRRLGAPRIVATLVEGVGAAERRHSTGRLSGRGRGDRQCCLRRIGGARGIRGRRGRWHRDRLRRRPRRRRGPAAAGRFTGRGRDLAHPPVRGLSAGRSSRALRRPGGRDSGARDR